MSIRLSMLSSNRGNSLIQVVVAAGLMALVALGVASLISDQGKQVRALSEKLATKEVETQLRSLLSNSTYCACLLRGKTFNTRVGEMGFSPARQLVRLKTGFATGPKDTVPCLENSSDLVPEVGMPVLGTDLRVKSIDLTSMQAGASPGAFKADLEVAFSGGVRAIKSIKTAVQFRVSTDLGTPQSRPFSACENTSYVVDAAACAAKGGSVVNNNCLIDVCKGNCMTGIPLPRELDGGNSSTRPSVMTTANFACQHKGYPYAYDWVVTRHGSSCGCGYGICSAGGGGWNCSDIRCLCGHTINAINTLRCVILNF